MTIKKDGNKTLFIALATIILSAAVLYGTAQIPDILRYRGEDLPLFSNPLEPYFQQAGGRPEKFFEGGSTACWRGYQAFWEIEGDRLYLTRIGSCLDGKESYDLMRIFGDRVKKGRVEALWFSGTLVVPRGNRIAYVHMGYGSRYEKYLLIQIHEGRVTGAEEKTDR